MNNTRRFALLALMFTASVVSAQGRGEQDAQAPAIGPKPDFSFCVSRLTAEGLKKEAFYTNVAKTSDTAAMKQALEDFAWSGDNAMLKDVAELSTECASFHSEEEATSDRDHRTAAAVVAGFALKPEFKY